MAGDNDKDKKGFAGLLDLVSEVCGIDEPIKPEPKTEAKPSAPEQLPQPQQETTTSEPERKTTSSPPPIETVSSGKSGGGSGGKWILGIIGVIFVIWLINNGEQSNKKPEYDPPSSSQNYSHPQSSPAPAVQTPSASQSGGLQYTKPSVGTNNVLAVPEISWCIREDIRIEAMRDVIDTNEGIGEFNRIVDDYNSRCVSYRFCQGDQSQAERYVEHYRSQIVSEAIREAVQLGPSNQPSYPSVSAGSSTNSTAKKPNAQITRVAQQLLIDLGYDPGPVDGDYGRRTASAVQAFQRDAGITQDGWIDEDLLSRLRKAKSTHNPPVTSQPKPQSQSGSQQVERPAPQLTPLAALRATSKRALTVKGVTFNMVYIPPGEYMRGSPSNELGRDSDEPQHRVRISKGYWMGETEVTQGLWQAVMGNNPSRFTACGSNCPVEQVSWNESQDFIKRLNGMVSGGGFRLPTEAEWEYAARAGTTTAIYTGSMNIRGQRNSPELDPIAWYGGNSGVNYSGGHDCSGWTEKQYSSNRCGTHPVAKKQHNAWGLYDMIGNVWEWTADWYGGYPSGFVTDPTGPSSGALRVFRGGCWHDGARYCRSANRYRHAPGYRSVNLGLRLARTDIEKHSEQIPESNNPKKYTKLGQGGTQLPDDATQAQGWLMTRDNKTGLIWEVKTQNNKDKRYTWEDAQGVFIASLNRKGFGGFSDWRIPKRDELVKLVKKGQTPTIDTTFFPNTVSSDYWSSTSGAYNTHTLAWLVSFYYGLVSSNVKTHSYQVRAVRAGQ